MIAFTIPCVPIAEPRKRVKLSKSKTGKVVAQHYTPKADPVNAFKATARISASMVMKRQKPLLGPLRLELTFVMPRTQNQFWKTKPMPRIWHDKKPDFDNLAKSICDALNGLVWHDDSQICDTRTIKLIASGDEQPRVELRVEQLTPIETQ